MGRFPIKFSSTTLWLLAAASLLTLEVCATATRVLPPVMANHHSPVNSRTATASSVVARDTRTLLEADSVFVISNVGSVEDGDIEVRLKAVPINAGHEPASATTVNHQAHYIARPDVEHSPLTVRTLTRPETAPRQLERLYFVPTAIPQKHREMTYAAVSCRLIAENHHARIYLDRRLPQDDKLAELVTAIDQASSSTMVDKINQLVGLPEDLDGDDHLTIVVTPELDRLGTANAPVRGLTQPNDFVHAIDRPHGNQSDVIYLNSSLQPGEHLSAVIAHEWCHASVFSRRRQQADDLGTDEDWLSEAIAHVVEVGSSGSDSNIAHRIQSYLRRPAHSPLVVRDYCRPEYWRHDGCRGAGYLFLKWYLDEFPGTDLSAFTSDQQLGIQGLEATTHHSFDQLFADWASSLGKQLAADLGGRGSAKTPLSHHQWKLEEAHQQTVVLRIGGTCADFVHIQCSDPSRWRIMFETTKPATLRTSVLSVQASAH